MEHGWLTDRRHLDRDFDMWCPNKKCPAYNERQVIPGTYETDTGWGEPDWIECDCGTPMQSWPVREE